MGEWAEVRIQLRAIYTCARQLPSHNTVRVQPANISRLMLPTQTEYRR